jgi:ribose transport system substrate-binding protein
MRKIIVYMIVFLLLVPVAVFAGGSKEEEKIVIGLTLPSLAHPFFVYLQRNVMDEAELLDVEIVAIDAENVAAKQMSIVEDFISKGVEGVLMSPIGTDALVPAVESLNRAGIPIATVDRKVSGGVVLVHVGADNVEGGRVAARYLLEQLGGRGGVLELEGTPGASPAIDRKAGFDEIIATSDIKILVSQTAKFERATGQSVMENLLQVHKDFQGVFAANDEMVLGSIEAIEAAGVDTSKIILVGYDAIPDALNYIKDGRLDATIEQFPGEQAKQSLRYLVEYIREGKNPPSTEVYITPVAITIENLDDAEHKVE